MKMQRNLTAEEIAAVIIAEPVADSEAMQAPEIWQCGECKRVYRAWRYSGYGKATAGCGCQGAHQWPAQYSLTVSPANYTHPVEATASDVYKLVDHIKQIS